MKNIKTYTVHLKVLTPVHIGSGKTLARNEYIFNNNTGKLIIPDINKMMQFFINHELIEDYINYMTKYSNTGKSLAGFLSKHNISEDIYNKWEDYNLHIADKDILDEKGINLFTKDAYKKIYIPGSSLKGALRTVLANMEILEKKNLSGTIKSEVIKLNAENDNRYKFYCDKMSKIYKDTDEGIFTREIIFDSSKDFKEDKKVYINIMSGLTIGDSKPCEASALIACQKIDCHTDGSQNSLPLLRECIKPGTEIVFPLTINENIFEWKIEDIKRAVVKNYNNYCNEFLSKFNTAGKLKEADARDNVIFIGGGIGYPSKTYTYAAIRGKEGINQTSKILNKLFSGKKHNADISKGASPRVLKCTKYCDRIVQMGACLVSFEDGFAPY